MSEASQDQLVLSRTAILEAVKRLALDVLQLTIPEAQISLIDGGNKVDCDHWVSSTLLDVSKAQILMRVHFQTTASRFVTRKYFGGQSGHTAVTTHDQIKEYCNIVMGRIKAALSQDVDSETIKQVFLPKIEAGYDRFEKIQETTEPMVQEMWWKIEMEESFELIMYAMVKSETPFNSDLIARITSNHGVASDDEGEVEFF
jgi:hypothetical protein